MPTVVLNAMPVGLFHAFDEATEGLLREYRMEVLTTAQPFTDADIATAREAKQRIAAAIGSATDSVDLRLQLSAGQAAAFPVLQGVLDHANRMAREERLLCLPVLPEIAALRNWICDQVVNQSNGAAPLSWQLPTNPEEPGVAPATWPGMASLPEDEAWIVGDDANRIIGASAAALTMLGWDQLVGERIVVVIPPEFREGHIAAFTRGVVSGAHHLLDRPLQLAALTKAGETIDIVLTLSRHAARGDRAVYLAKLERR
jgi:PAS domain-containing protein